jgi:hypothetical protein
MQEYFKNLDTVDPLFHALVLSKLKEVQESERLPYLTIDDLTEQHELEILREYCVTLYKEYRALRAVFLENMQLGSHSVRLKNSTKQN